MKLKKLDFDWRQKIILIIFWKYYFMWHTQNIIWGIFKFLKYFINTYPCFHGVKQNLLFFMSESAIYFIKWNIYKGIEVYKSKEELLNIDNSKKQLNHQLNIAILKKFAKYFFFFFTNLSQSTFSKKKSYYCPYSYWNDTRPVIKGFSLVLSNYYFVRSKIPSCASSDLKKQ